MMLSYICMYYILRMMLISCFNNKVCRVGTCAQAWITREKRWRFRDSHCYCCGGVNVTCKRLRSFFTHCICISSLLPLFLAILLKRVISLYIMLVFLIVCPFVLYSCLTHGELKHTLLHILLHLFYIKLW